MGFETIRNKEIFRMNNNLKHYISLVFARWTRSRTHFASERKLYMVGSEPLCRFRRYRSRRMTPSTICSILQIIRCRYKVWQAFEREGEDARPRFLCARNPLVLFFCFIFVLPAFLDTDLLRRNRHERDS